MERRKINRDVVGEGVKAQNEGGCKRRKFVRNGYIFCGGWRSIRGIS